MKWNDSGKEFMKTEKNKEAMWIWNLEDKKQHLKEMPWVIIDAEKMTTYKNDKLQNPGSRCNTELQT